LIVGSLEIANNGSSFIAHCRPGKTATPTMMTQVRISPRHNSEGYKHVELLDTHHQSKVPKAASPKVLQIAEMQRLGVEDCDIDPAELTKERLQAGRDDNESCYS
jgi:hypothetical protein